MTVTCVDMNRDGIPDVLQQPQISYAAPVQQAAPAVTYSTHSEHSAPAPVVDNVSHLEQCEELVTPCPQPQFENSGQSSTKLRSRRTSHQEAGEKSESKSFTKRVTEKTQVTTGQSVVCQCCTSCLPQYYMLDSPLACTECNLPTKQGFGPTIDVTITLWCTECWSNVVASGVYRCTSARSTSRKHSTVSNIQPYGIPCSSTVLNQHT